MNPIKVCLTRLKVKIIYITSIIHLRVIGSLVIFLTCPPIILNISFNYFEFIKMGEHMYYLIPAWYGQGAEFWQPDLTPWYFRTSKIEFDDTLHQARIFQGQAMSPRLLLLAYQHIYVIFCTALIS